MYCRVFVIVLYAICLQIADTNIYHNKGIHQRVPVISTLCTGLYIHCKARDHFHAVSMQMRASLNAIDIKHTLIFSLNKLASKAICEDI